MSPRTNPARDARLHSITGGTGSGVLCLHSSGSSSGQWRRLIDAEQADFRFVAFDLLGHGRSPDFAGEVYTLGSESEAVFRSLAPAGEPMHLVGHSYGGAVALDLAVRHPGRFASVTVFEPVLFALLDRTSSEFREISSVGFDIVRAARAGDLGGASATFVDYWSGDGSWHALSAEQQQRVRDRIVPVARHFEALFSDPLPLDRLRALRVPTLVLLGDRSPSPARAVCSRLGVLPSIRVEVLPGLAHMAPVTHPAVVNRRIRDHLDGVAPLRFAA